MACREPGRAPLADDNYEAPDSDETTEDTDVILDEDDDALQYCGETSVLLPITRPTFYFIVDASGSMAEEMPNSAGHSRAWAARAAMVEMLRVLSDRVNYGAAAFPGSDSQDSCAPGEQVFAPHRGDHLDSTIDGGDSGPVLQAMMFNLAKVGPYGSTPTSATLAELRPMLKKLGPKTTAFLLTDGVPNCTEARTCDSDECVGDIDRLELDNGQICGVDVMCCDPGLFPYLCLDADATNDNLAALAEAGIRTYVIGFPGSDAYGDVLNGMARAAQTAQVDAETEYYRVTDVGDLAETLTHLGRDLSLDCSIALEAEPKDPDKVSVVADRELVPPDSDDGWRWEGPTEVTLVGQACDAWREGRWDRLSVVEGCDFRVR